MYPFFLSSVEIARVGANEAVISYTRTMGRLSHSALSDKLEADYCKVPPLYQRSLLPERNVDDRKIFAQVVHQKASLQQAIKERRALCKKSAIGSPARPFL